MSYQIFTQAVGNAQVKKLKEAAASCRARLLVVPRDVGLMYALGMIECQLGHLPAAQQWLEKALAVNPDASDIRCHYGLVLLEQGNDAEAVAALRRVVALVPGHVEAVYRLGYALARLGQAEEAAVFYEQAVAMKPDHVEALNALGNLLHNKGAYEDALVRYRRAIEIKTDYAAAYNNMGLTLAALGNFVAAEDSYRQALALKPDYAEALNNLGVACMLRDRYDEAMGHYRAALALRPGYAEAYSNLGNALKDTGQLDEAIKQYRKAVHLRDAPEFRHNLSLALLMMGRFEEGWREYEWRWKTGQLELAHAGFTQPQWRGDAAAGKTILIHAEQGFGDTLQFCRYASLVKARGLRVIMLVPPSLAALVGSLRDVDQVVAQGQPLPDFDFHCPMLSLPRALGTVLATIPADVPYLFADEQAVAAWRAKLPAADGALRVGLVWAGGLRTQSQDMIATNRRRSMTVENLRALMDIAGVQFYNLQKDATEIPAGVIDHMSECENFADTAALVANLDLVISVDTAVVHLAGALGKPVWMLNRFNSCWRWLHEGENSVWYPTLRQFRQTHLGDWDSVMIRVRDALALYAARP